MIKSESHPVYKSYYLEMFALYDLEKNEECFGKYGVSYWERPQFYSKFDSPHTLTGDKYNDAITDAAEDP